MFFAVIATTATLAAVFIPLSFLPGQTGGLFREFGFVLAMSVLLSSVVALSLCPMLASRMLTESVIHHHDGGIGGRIGGALAGLYRRCLHACLNAPLIVAAGLRAVRRHRLRLFGLIRQELTPVEDRSIVMLRINAPQGVSLDYTTQQMRRDRAADPAAARFRRDRQHLRQRRPGRPEQ